MVFWARHSGLQACQARDRKGIGVIDSDRWCGMFPDDRRGEVSRFAVRALDWSWKSTGVSFFSKPWVVGEGLAMDWMSCSIRASPRVDTWDTRRSRLDNEHQTYRYGRISIIGWHGSGSGAYAGNKQAGSGVDESMGTHRWHRRGRGSLEDGNIEIRRRRNPKEWPSIIAID
jgi:hypothetical protein